MPTRVRSKGSSSTWMPYQGTTTKVTTTPTSFNPLVLADTEHFTDRSTSGKTGSDYCLISDVYGESKTRYNACSHSQYIPPIVVAPGGSKSVVPPEEYWHSITQDKMTSFYASGGVYRYALDTLFGSWPTRTLPSLDWGSIVTKVGSKLDARLKADMNILVFFAQIGQTIGMVKKPLKIIKNPKAAWTLAKKNLSLKDLSNSAASQYLEYQWGWKQLQRDVIGFGKALSRAKAHVEYLESKEGKLRNISASQVDIVNPNKLYGTTSGYYTHKFLWSGYRRTARFSVSHKLKAVNNTFRMMDAFTDAIGAKDFGFALWDYLPWSFVIDWIVDLGALYKDPRADFRSHKLYRVGWSQKFEWLFKPTVTLKSSYFYDNSRLIDEWNGSEIVCRKTYGRTPGFPPGADSAGIFGSFSKHSIGNAAALIIQQAT